MDALFLPVVHPPFQQLRRNARFLHLVAASLIIIHAVGHLLQPNRSMLYFICLFLIAFDIVILFISKQNGLTEQPRINLIFRVIEFILLVGMGAELISKSMLIAGSIHIIIGVAYCYLSYCENTVSKEERVSIHHTGVSVPSLPEGKFFIWSTITHLTANYSSISIETSFNKSYYFEFEHNLQFEEMDQIHEFCRHYLGVRN